MVFIHGAATAGPFAPPSPTIIADRQHDWP